jgi:hypothetical protein
MKTVNNTTHSERQARKQRLKDLIKACLYRYSESEMLDAFNEATGSDYIDERDIEEPEKMSEFDMTNELTAKGYCIFKPDNFLQAEQLKEYAATNIFRYYNEQQTAILF